MESKEKHNVKYKSGMNPNSRNGFKKGISNPMFGKHSPSYKGGRFISSEGYVFIYKPNHPNANGRNYVREHHLVMEQHLGRFLTKKEVVHHLDYNTTNNQIDNLHLFSNDIEHRKYHRFLRQILRGEICA